MYLIGRFERESLWPSTNPLNSVGKVAQITKDHLVKAQQDENYQVINLLTMEYFDPSQNKWVKIQSFDK